MARILVIEDDPAVRGLFQTVLQRGGHTVIIAATAAEGFHVLREGSVDMVITDLNLSEASGLDVLAMMTHDFPATKVLVVSGEFDQYASPEANAYLQAVEVLPKPVGVTHLLGTVHRILGHS